MLEGREEANAGEPMVGVVRPPSRSLALPAGFSVVDGEFTIAGDPPYEQWQQCGPVLAQIEGAIQWVIGDWLNYGEHAYGEKYADAVDPQQAALWTHYSWLARAVAPCLRKQKSLSYSHHGVVAKLEPADQEQWLDKAIAEQWTVREFRAAVRGVHPPDAWTLDEALKIGDEKLCWLRDRWPPREWEALVNLLRGFADGLEVDA